MAPRFLLSAVLFTALTICVAWGETPPPPLAEGSGAPKAERRDPFPLIVDHKAQSKLDTARDDMVSGHPADALRLAQEVLNTEDDPFVRVRVEIKGKVTTQFIPAKLQAEWLFRQDLDQYEKLYGEKAMDLLLQPPWGKEGIGKLAGVAARYPYTDAGSIALKDLAVRTFDAGDIHTAAHLFARLFSQNAGRMTLETPVLFRRAIAFRITRTNAEANEAWDIFARRLGDETFAWSGNKKFTVKDAKRELDKFVERAEPKPLDDWRMLGGSASRFLRAAGGPPLFAEDWVLPLNGDKNTQGLRDDLESVALQRGELLMPTSFPIAVTCPSDPNWKQVVICRSWSGIDVVDPATGKVLWKPITSYHEVPWTPGTMKNIDDYQMRGLIHLLLENPLMGSISSDGKSVYMIEDAFVFFLPKVGVKPPVWVRRSNVLLRYDLPSGGKLI
jgi:hypothetical protein